jgi:hypothetical protein
MLVDINKLISVANFAKQKEMSRQHIYRLFESGELTLIKIDDLAFVYLDEKAENYKRKRQPKMKKD